MNTTPETYQPSSVIGPQEEQSYSFVLLCGLATTALALLGVYLLNANTDEHIMGWYANYVLPVGAIIVGVVASSGYGLASWFSGIKITRSLLWMVLGLQLAAYFAAQFIEFKSLRLMHMDGSPVGFLEYFDLVARSFAWKQTDGSAGTPLGVWGYVFRGLEILGFAAGGLIVPLALRKAPYCQAYQRYMRTRALGFIPASVAAKKIKKSDEAGKSAHEAEQQQAFNQGKQTADSLQQLALAAKAAEFQKRLAELALEKKQTLKLPARISLQLVHCRRCCSGRFLANLMVGQANQMRTTEVSKTELNAEFVRMVCQ